MRIFLDSELAAISLHALAKDKVTSPPVSPNPKFAPFRRAHSANFGFEGTLANYCFGAAFRFEVPVADSRQSVQELQIGATRINKNTA
jgi:hypothetical protein